MLIIHAATWNEANMGFILGQDTIYEQHGNDPL
jgi:hypothetical protein